MCCIFTCCGWVVDLVQRVWTFTMSCIIMSAVMGVMSVSSMAGIALGYNYSLAEYVELKETNVSVYLKRGVFDDEVVDDMEWRRAGHLPVKGQINDENLLTGAPADEITTLRSGRRLDDSVFDADDHHNYEGHLMKLTAKPLHLEKSTDMTDDVEMAKSLTRYPMGSLDQMKAIQSLIDSRRAMATGGTTMSPLATYGNPTNYLPIIPLQNNPNLLAMTPVDEYRRIMPPGQRRSDIAGGAIPQINQARYAVPSDSLLTNKEAWRLPKYPDYYNVPKTVVYDGGAFRMYPTYPTAITVSPMLVRPTPPVNDDQNPAAGAVMFPYSYSPINVKTTQPAPLRQSGQEQSDVDQRPDFYNEKVLMEGDELSKKDMPKMESGGKSAEEEYEDEIKGLPVRRRRSIYLTEINNKDTKHNGNNNKRSVKNIFTSSRNEIDGSYEDIFIINKNISIVEASNNTKTATTISHKDNTIQHMNANVEGTLDLENKLEIVREQDRNENGKGQSLLKYLDKSIEATETSLVAETAPKTGLVKSSDEDIRINTKLSLFESKIVPTKYVANNLATEFEKKQPLNNKGILNSISVRLKDEELLRNHATKFLKVLQTIFTT